MSAFGLGLGLWLGGQAGGGGAPSGPVMMTGINLGNVTESTRARPYANAIWAATPSWEALSATGAWEQSRGAISGADPGDQFNLPLFAAGPCERDFGGRRV